MIFNKNEYPIPNNTKGTHHHLSYLQRFKLIIQDSRLTFQRVLLTFLKKKLKYINLYFDNLTIKNKIALTHNAGDNPLIRSLIDFLVSLHIKYYLEVVPVK